MARKQSKPAHSPEFSPGARLSPEELRLSEQAGRLVYAVEDAIRAAGLTIKNLTVAGGEGVVVLTGFVQNATVRRQVGKVAAGVPGVQEVVNSITIGR